MIEIDNVKPVTVVQYSITEWQPLEQGWVLVKGVANGQEFNGVLQLRTDPEGKSPV